MKRKSLVPISCVLVLFLTCNSAMAQTELPTTDKQYHERINQLWNQNKTRYEDMIKGSGNNPRILYNIQAETKNLLKYAGYSRKYALVGELSGLYLHALNTLTETDQYLYAYYPDSQRLSVHPLDKKYRMWVDKEKPIGREIILDSSQFLYSVSDTVSIIADVKKDERTPIMNEALNKFIPLLVEHYNRWIFNKPGPFQVRGWSSCRYNGQYVPSGMNHQEFITKKLERTLANGKSPAYCNAVQDIDMFIIAGVANILTVYKKDEGLVPITPEEFKKLLSYVKLGAKLLESRFSYTQLKNFAGEPVVGAIFDRGAGDEHPDVAYAGYSGQERPKTPSVDKSQYRGKNIGWDLSHARRFVHVFDSLIKSKEILGLAFPTKSLLEEMANQFVYATFNRDFKKPLFTNFMDGTNGWYRVDYEGRKGFGYGPWKMSMSVIEGGYGFWSVYNTDIQKVFVSFMDMVKSSDPDIRKHVIDHYSVFGKTNHPRAQSVLMQFLPSLCFMYK